MQNVAVYYVRCITGGTNSEKRGKFQFALQGDVLRVQRVFLDQ